MGLAAEDAEQVAVMIDATYLKAHRVVSSPRAKEGMRAFDRASQGRIEHQAECRQGRERPAFAVFHDGWPGERLHRWCGPDWQFGRRRMPDRCPGL